MSIPYFYPFDSLFCYTCTRMYVCVYVHMYIVKSISLQFQIQKCDLLNIRSSTFLKICKLAGNCKGDIYDNQLVFSFLNKLKIHFNYLQIISLKTLTQASILFWVPWYFVFNEQSDNTPRQKHCTTFVFISPTINPHT